MTSTDQTLAAIDDREYRARFLLDIFRAATSHLDLSEVLEAVSTSLRPRLEFDTIALLVNEGGYVRLHSLFSHDLPRNPGESVQSLVARLRAKRSGSPVQGSMLLHIAISDSCIGQFLNSSDPYVSEDLAEGARFPEEELLRAHGVRSYISLPLMRREQLIGAVHFVCYRPMQVSHEDLQLLVDASAIVSIAVSNALAYEEIKVLQEQLKNENEVLQSEIDQGSMYEEIVGSSAPLTRVLDKVDKVAQTETTVLLTGETGSGKELVARAIHRRSPRADRAMVKVNCAALPQELIASELFGHEKGSFTGAVQRRIGRFEAADSGTIFLDEVGELPPEMQVALLRVLQEREFERVGGNTTIQTNVRVIAATNRDLRKEVAEGRFREDLYYRLDVFPIHCPALRERRDDIPLLVEYFIARFAARLGKKIDLIESNTLERLMNYSWPGNIRELQNVVERAVILAEGRTFQLEPGLLDHRHMETAEPPAGASESPAGERQRQRAEIEEVLRQTGGRVSGPNGAAKRLGVPASTLESRIRNLGINKHSFRWRSAH
jgi:formate hydrogenlyase transcriptional activator